MMLLAPAVILTTQRDKVLVIVRERHSLDAVTMKNQLGVHRTHLKVPDNDFSLDTVTHINNNNRCSNKNESIQL